MNKTFTFLSELNQQGIKLQIVDEQLRINAPQGVLTPELTTQLKARKAEILAFLQQSRIQPEVTAIQPVSRTKPLPLSFAQERFWFLDQLGSGAIYTMPIVLRLEGRLDLPALEQTLTKIVKRHESLRTTFTLAEGQARQIIHPPTTIDLPIIDLQQVSTEEQTTQVAYLARQETLRPFNLSSDLMMRATLLRLGSETHILLLTMHHIASDGWSLGVLVRELTTLYKAFTQGNPSPLPPLPIQYADFATWQRNRLQGEDLEKQLTYWKTQLAGAPELLQLPTDYPRPAMQTFGADKHNFQIEANLTQRLRHLSQQAGTTLFMTLLAAFQVLLARYSRQNDIVVHSPIANRTQQAIEPLIGVFINDLALRANLSGNPTFLALLQQVRQVTQAAYEHQDLPFNRLVEALQPQRHLGYHPLVQVSFALQNAPMGAFALSGLQVQPVNLEIQETRMDMEVHVWEQGDSLTGSFIYNTSLFAPASIERMIGHFQTLLARVVAQPEFPVGALPLLPASERQQLLVTWNQTETDVAHNQCLHQLFEAQVEQTPEAIAVIFEDEHLTYQELNQRANQLAHHLQAQGVGPDVFVGLCVERSFEMLVGMLGILKAGGAYIPLDPAYPVERIAFILQETQTPLLLTQQKLVAQLSLEITQIITLDSDWADIATQPKTNPASPVAPHNLAYVIYTSGSTGKPKGVLIEHESVAAHCVQYQDFYAVTPADRALQLSSFHFDASVEQIFPVLLSGGSVVVSDWDLDPVSFSQNLQRFGVTILDLAGGHWRLLVQTWLKDPVLMANSPLRIVILGADVMPIDVIPLWRQLPLSKQARLFNVYGPTETTVAAVVFEVTNAFDSNQSRIPIGKPLANKKVYILDPSRQPVPIGVPGELYIGGLGPARGYLNRPELTREKFVTLTDLRLTAEEKMAYHNDSQLKTNQPLSRYNRLYRTGDLVRWRPDGTLDFLGRLDQQVKIRSFRVELGEIETVLRQHTVVQDALVLVRGDEGGYKRLVAYIIPQLPETKIPELREHLKKSLPDYMVPDAFVSLNIFPQTPGGKIDRKALPEPEAMVSTAPYEPPGNAAEQKIATIWEQVLNRAEISIHDNFFDVGGHSLLAIQVHSLLREGYPTLKIVDLFSYPTIHTLAGYLAQNTNNANGNSKEEQTSQARGAKRRAHQAARQRRNR